MRSYVPAYELVAPGSLATVLRMLDRDPDGWRPIAGGTDLMVLFEAGKLPYRKLISIWDLAELKQFVVESDHITLGALTTYTEVRRSEVVAREFPLLVAAARETGGLATQNRGTLGGNIANGSPAADSPPALLVCDADLELVSAAGSRWVLYRDFHVGYKTMDLLPNELIARIRLPRRRPGWRQYYRKVGTRRAQAISKVCFAGALRMEGGRVADVRVALGSVAPIPLRCGRTEALLRGQTITPELVSAAAEELGREITPIDDIRSNAVYRRRVAQRLLAQFLSAA